MAMNSSGSVRLTADGAVGRSGVPCRVFLAVALSGAGGAGEIVLRNGTTAAGTVYVQQDGTAASKTTILNFGAEGLVFPAGCFFDIDANIAAIVVECRSEAK